MKQVFKCKVSEIQMRLDRLGLSPEQEVTLTIEESSDTLLSLMDKIRKKAQDKGLTEAKLAELLADES